MQAAAKQDCSKQPLTALAATLSPCVSRSLELAGIGVLELLSLLPHCRQLQELQLCLPGQLDWWDDQGAWRSLKQADAESAILNHVRCAAACAPCASPCSGAHGHACALTPACRAFLPASVTQLHFAELWEDFSDGFTHSIGQLWPAAAVSDEYWRFKDLAVHMQPPAATRMLAALKGDAQAELLPPVL